MNKGGKMKNLIEEVTSRINSVIDIMVGRKQATLLPTKSTRDSKRAKVTAKI